MLRTASSLPLAGLLTLGFDPTRFQMKPPACYRATWQLPEPDSHRQATTSLRTANHLQRQPPAPLDARKIEANAPGRELPALSGVLGPAARAEGVLFRQSGFRIRRPRLSTGTGLSAPDMDQNFPNRADPVDLGRHGNSESSTDAFGPAFMGGSRYAN